MDAEIDDLLHEDRTFPPSSAFRGKARIQDEQIYAEADRDPGASGRNSRMSWVVAPARSTERLARLKANDEEEYG